MTKTPTYKRPVPKYQPTDMVGRAFQRITDDITLNYVSPPKRGRTNRRIAYVPRGRRAPRGRRTPPRPRGQNRQAAKGKGHEIFSLFL